MTEFTVLFGTLQMQIIVWLIAADVVLAVLSALLKKEFSFRKLGNFMRGPVLGYIFGFAVIELVGQAIPTLAITVQVVFALVVIALVASLLRNLSRFGFSLPAVFQ